LEETPQLEGDGGRQQKKRASERDVELIAFTMSACCRLGWLVACLLHRASAEKEKKKMRKYHEGKKELSQNDVGDENKTHKKPVGKEREKYTICTFCPMQRFRTCPFIAKQRFRQIIMLSYHCKLLPWLHL
jgi:hypothetical protein